MLFSGWNWPKADYVLRDCFRSMKDVGAGEPIAQVEGQHAIRRPDKCGVRGL